MLLRTFLDIAQLVAIMMTPQGNKRYLCTYQLDCQYLRSVEGIENTTYTTVPPAHKVSARLPCESYWISSRDIKASELRAGRI